MAKVDVKFWFRDTFIRDLEFSRRALGYLILVLCGVVYNMIFIIAVVFMDGAQGGVDSDVLRTSTLAALSLGVACSGWIVDTSRDKIHLTFVFFVLSTIGIGFMVVPATILSAAGTMLVAFSTAVVLVTWITVIIHETTPLNRGRIGGMVLVMGLFVSLIVLFFIVNGSLRVLAFLPMLLIAGLNYFYSFEYFVFDAKETLRTTRKFREVILNKNVMGYTLAIGFLAFSMGILLNHYPFEVATITNFMVAIVLGIIVGGILIDNTGRKTPFVIASFLFFAVLLFYNDPIDPNVFAVVYGVVFALLVILVISIAGDYTVEKARAYRSRIISLLFLGLVMGVGAGYAIAELFVEDPVYRDVLTRISIFFVVLEIATLMPLEDSLNRKDTEWYKHLRTLYVFHTASGICLFDHNFAHDRPGKSSPSKDLVSGGLTGIVALVSEITQSQSRIRIVDHGDSKIIFQNGKYTTIALITRKYLRTFVQKLRAFSKEFEDIFQDFLLDFRGDVTIFDSAEFLIEKFFQQKYMSLRDFFR